MSDYSAGTYIMVLAIMIGVLVLIPYQLSKNNENIQQCKDCPTQSNLNDGSATEVKSIPIGNLKDCIDKFPEGYNHKIYVVNKTPSGNYTNPSILELFLNPNMDINPDHVIEKEYYCSVTFWSSDLQNQIRSVN